MAATHSGRGRTRTTAHRRTPPIPFRGIRTGTLPPPTGYAADDFRIPTLQEVLEAFPFTPINIEIRMMKTRRPGNPNDASCVNGDGAPPGATLRRRTEREPRAPEALGDASTSREQPKKHPPPTATTSSSSPSPRCRCQEFRARAPRIKRLRPGSPSLSGYASSGCTPLVPDVGRLPGAAAPGRDPRARGLLAAPQRAPERLRGPRRGPTATRTRPRALQAAGRPRGRRDHDHAASANAISSSVHRVSRPDGTNRCPPPRQEDEEE